MLKKSQIKHYLILLIIYLISGVVLAGCGSVETADTGKTNLEIIDVSKGKLVGELLLPGVLIPEKSATISAQISSVVENVLVKKGQTVKQGEELIILDDQDLIVKYNQAQAGLKQSGESSALAKNKYETTEKEFARIKALYEVQGVSQQDYESYLLKLEGDKSTYETAKIAVEAARANLAAVELQLDRTVLYSPLDGEIVDIEVAEGEMVSPGTTIVTIATIDKLIFKTNIAERDTNLIQVGQKAQARIGALPNKDFSGEVSHISPISAETGEQYPLEIVFENTDKFLKAGMTGNVKIEVSSAADSLVVPQDAIVVRNGLNYVFKVNEDKVVQQKVTIGIHNNQQAVIVEGLTEGEQVIRGDLSGVYDGKKI
ncbi:MAG: efflux RND transporter periplasmic adaptor subunit [Peptococcaceae bacterium]